MTSSTSVSGTCSISCINISFAPSSIRFRVETRRDDEPRALVDCRLCLFDREYGSSANEKIASTDQYADRIHGRFRAKRDLGAGKRRESRPRSSTRTARKCRPAPWARWSARGEKVTQGYWRNPEKTKEAFDENGWFHTGDLAYRDEDGYFYFADRAGDRINRGGENIFPIEVERVLARHPKIAEVAVFGVPDPAWGQKVMAAAVLHQGQSVTEEDIIRFSKENLANYKAPSSILSKDALPRTFEGGKVKRNVLREEYVWKQREERKP